MYKGRTATLLKLKFYTKFKMAIFFVIFLLIGACFFPLSSSHLVNRNPRPYPETIDGQIIFAPMDSRITYLINSAGVVNHTWSSSWLPGEAVWWLGDGTILRTIKTGGSGTGGSGGGVQIIQWDGTLEWDYRYNTNGDLSHHDVKSLPNGNVLLIAWETKTRNEAIAAGRNPSEVPITGFMPDHIIEVQPTGPTSGTIVWEWHVWDHLIQDYDSSKTNYGVVGNHPELVDINYVTLSASDGSDWMHTNSIDYNEQYDQLMLSVHNFNEIWVIDHSTTTAEATSHTGGNSGNGGDLLYRWGNPQAYRAGTTSDQKFFNQHDATWIKSGFPGEGNILVFNNGGNRPGDHYSTVDEIVPPVNDTGEYYLSLGSAYGPTAQTWIYTASPPTSFYSSHLSGAQRLTNGNTLICNGIAGKFFEVTPDGTTVWQYTNPFPTPIANNVFKIVYLPPGEQPEPEVPNLDCSGSLSWTNIEPGATVNGSFQVQNIGDTGSLLNWTINTSSISWGTWSYTPESGENLTPEDGQITVHVSVIAPDEENSDFEGYIRVENQNDSNDFDIIPVTLKTPTNINVVHQALPHQFLLQFLQRHLFIEKLWNLFSPGYIPLSH
jgi:hypothetical protein